MLKTPGQLKNFKAPNTYLKDVIYVLKRINIFDGINFMFRFQLKWLDLCANKIGDGGFIAMSSCISKIEELRIGSSGDDNLTMKGISALSNAVANSPTKVRVITFILQGITIVYSNAFFGLDFCISIQISYQNLFRVYFKSTNNLIRKQS